ncbi:gas vesicle protein GvpO [Virgibacillus kekensis]|uniref:Gas vesicle protein GvpO n=1 Tax=Virgibacillus kekensis TaxID=202261 RepID=A0ABV9DI88_9BACI
MKVIDEVTNFFNSYVAPPHKVISVKKQNDDNEANAWFVQVEVIEEKEYMKRYGNDQMIGLYEVFLDNDVNVTGFERISLRYRSDLVDQPE